MLQTCRARYRGKDGPQLNLGCPRATRLRRIETRNDLLEGFNGTAHMRRPEVEILIFWRRRKELQARWRRHARSVK